MGMGIGTRKNSDTVIAAAVINAKPCVVTAIRCLNATAAAAWCQFYDASSTASITVGTTKPDWVVGMAASDHSLGDGVPTDGLKFENGIVAATTTTMLGGSTSSCHVRLVIW